MKFSQKVFILLALSTSSLTVSDLNAGNFKGCVKAQDGLCLLCYRRKLLAHQTSCGPLQPTSDTCEFYIWDQEQGSICYGCKKGYSLIPVKTAPNTYKLECKPGVISFCLDENRDLDGIERCELCAGGRYSVRQKGDKTDACLKIPNPAPHCAEGASADFPPAHCGL